VLVVAAIDTAKAISIATASNFFLFDIVEASIIMSEIEHWVKNVMLFWEIMFA